MLGCGAPVGNSLRRRGTRSAVAEDRGLVGVIMGRGADERDILLGLRLWAVVGENMLVRIDEEAAAEAAMSVSESGCTSGMFWSSGCCRLK
jgi:hypothetical protein